MLTTIILNQEKGNEYWNSPNHTYTRAIESLTQWFTLFIVATGVTTGTANKNNFIFKIVESPP